MKFFLFSLGCKVNSYELDTLRNALEKAGHKEVFSAVEADLIIVNTCSVTATADQKSRQHIRKFRRLAPGAKAGLGPIGQTTPALAQTGRDEIAKGGMLAVKPRRTF